MIGSKLQELGSFEGRYKLCSKCLGDPHRTDVWTLLWVPQNLLGSLNKTGFYEFNS